MYAVYDVLLLYLIKAWIWVTYLVLVSGEDFDLLSALHVVHSDREVVG